MVEVLTASFIALLVLSTSFLAAGNLIKHQRLAQQKALAASLAMMIGQWRMLTFSNGQYLDVTGGTNSYTPAGSDPTSTSFSDSASTFWGTCPLLTTTTTPLASTASTPDTIFVGGAPSDHPSSGASWYLVKNTTTILSNTAAITNYNLAAYQNLVVCISDPGSKSSVDNSCFRYMTIWSGYRPDFTGGNVNRRLVFLGRFLLPDGCK